MLIAKACDARYEDVTCSIARIKKKPIGFEVHDLKNRQSWDRNASTKDIGLEESMEPTHWIDQVNHQEIVTMKRLISRYGIAIPLLCVFVFTYTDMKGQPSRQWVQVLIENAFFYGLGFQMLGFAIGHIFFADAIAQQIGWEPGSPFQLEVGLAALAISVLGLVSPMFGFEFRLASALVSAVYLWGCAFGHIRDMIRRKNFAPGNAGYVFWWDILYPAFLLILLCYDPSRKPF